MHGQPAVVPVSGLAIASLSLGTLTLLPVGFFLLARPESGLALLIYYFIVGAPAVLAVVFGFIASGPTKRGERRGYGMAQCGIGLGLLALVAPYVAGMIAVAQSSS